MASDKTPVMILNELLQKQQANPIFELILNGTGTHDPLFKYRVSGLGLSEIGSGKSKKEAKHDAARRLLVSLGNSETSETVADLPTDVTSPYEDTFKENAVGDLGFFCIAEEFRQPEYVLTRDEGLPHARVFSIKCTVSSFVTEAQARSKKQAKQLAARKMLDTLKKYVVETGSGGDAKSREEMFVENERKSLAKLKTIDLAPTNHLKVGIKIDQYWATIRDADYPDPSLLDELKDHFNNDGPEWFQALENPIELMKDLFARLELDHSFMVHESVDQDKVIVSLKICSTPPWTFLGIGKSHDEAANSACRECLEFYAEMRN